MPIRGPKPNKVVLDGTTVKITAGSGIPGAKGDTGSQGPAGTAATVAVGTTTTLAPGSSATVTNSGTAGAAVLDFGIPQGATGSTGATGAAGSAATIAVGSVTTGTAGSTATVTNSGTSSAAVLDFTIPRGDKGDTGATGATGATGPEGGTSTLTTKGDLLTRTSSAVARLGVGATDGHVLKAASGETTGLQWQGQSEVIVVAISDETTAITTGTAKVTFRMPFAMTLTAVRASLSTASSSGLPTFDINESGSTILSTKITIDANETTSTTAATPPVISDTALADDAEITVDVDVAGTGAKGAKIYLIGRRV